ncbi:transposable element Tcb2 transposase [Trichonephila clavipes]|nr:transposable element Tcb2 transposase [Trichonephila clavipes]
MPSNTLRVHTDIPCRNCGGGDRVGIAIYRPFGEFRRAKSYCHLYGAQAQRQAYLLPHGTMNFVGLDLTSSDRLKVQAEEPGQGRRRATLSNEDRFLLLTARRHLNMNATLLQQHLRSATGTTVSTKNVRNRLHGVGLYARRPLSPYAAAIGDDFILMEDNSRPHRTNLVEDSLFEEGIVRMEWPACSPDMNPIEHVWDALKRRVAGRQPTPQTLQELERAF